MQRTVQTVGTRLVINWYPLLILLEVKNSFDLLKVPVEQPVTVARAISSHELCCWTFNLTDS